jgi:hypothetical protein
LVRAQAARERFSPKMRLPSLSEIKRGRLKQQPQRHCEQSEAIHSSFLLLHGLLRFARNDDKI